MKKLITIIAVAFVSCQQEQVQPNQPTPVNTTAGDNYVIANGSVWSNDTFLFNNYNYASFDATIQETLIMNRDTLNPQLTFCHLSTPLQSTGTDTLDPDGTITWLNLNGIAYLQPHVVCNITRYDPIGGLIEGSHYGYWVAANPPRDTIQINGVFSIVRQ